MGTVFRARQLDASRDVAIKIPHIDAQSNAEDMERFFRESKILAKLNSPHVMTIYSIGRTAADVPYAVCEYMEGQTLRKLINDGPMPWQRVSRIVLQICIGLKDAHSQGIVHRDLKPENIFLLEKPEPDFVKVIDFGLSKMFIDLTQSQKLTKTGFLLGTAGYISPELIAGKPVDHRCDIYALGCIIFEMLMGEKLFDADNSIGLIYKHTNESPEPQLAKLSSKVPAGFIEVLRKSLAKKAEDRFQNMSEFIVAIEAAAENKKSTKSQKTGLSLQICLAALVIALIPILYWMSTSAERSARKNPAGIEKAQGQLMDVRSLSRSQAKLLLNRAESDFTNGRLVDALKAVSTVTDAVLKSNRLKKSEYFSAFSMRLDCLIILDRLEEAKRFLKVSEANFPSPPESEELLYFKAQIAQRECKYDFALQTIGQCKTLRPTLVYGFKASVYESREDWAKAICQYQNSIGYLSGVPRATNVNDSLPDSIASLYARIGAAYCKAKDYKSAERNCLKALELSPSSLFVSQQLGRVYEAQGNIDKALQVSDDAVKANPEVSSAYSNRAWYHFVKRDYEKCISDADRAIELDPKNSYGYGQRALGVSRKGHINEAIQLYEKAVSVGPRSWFFHEDRGYLYGCLGEWRKELEDSEAELKLRPGEIISLNNKGFSLYKLQRYAEARKALEECVSRSPEYGTALLNMSWLCSLTNDPDQADRFAERVPAKDKGYPYFCAKALASLQRKDLKSAASFLAKAKEKIPIESYLSITKADFYYLQGMLHRDSGKFAEALDDFSKAIEISPNDAFIYQQRAKLFLQMKDEARAREDDERASQLLR